ncbi:isocitrate lyase/phosphoenolpyruvate mutase family protein [Shewanella sp. D64]|uniref:isocitrate lyase/PEP mutase family protein n=1 Tax=unclassified Shewanella TaxID=196818 RepID=UPI0022BA479D|nr:MULTISPECIES: isocitrate lyase/phosphoenolpyruvate mutase family protein [unclassified Shewanella]MEC4724467.1 isocitrate lyase/phosphoenolpyruvate mutase family protein [Shewanella sp. D64]MEC4736756.1 isocitrate lyase/phosphoenolpyruvate mutase family protein [Shewanella sp. E94]WBJ94578.1 isocitrate lyase/phosphoenolpyruvate mutase family protein [Shewanella sp. MTB7]
MFESRLQAFTELHTQSTNPLTVTQVTAAPLVLVNVWDAASAVLLQESGAKALATSSASRARSLGYPYGQVLPRQEFIGAVSRIVRVSKLPVSVDIESGYSDSPSEVVSLVTELVNLGVIGINLEDGDQQPELLMAKIAAIRASKSCRNLFINARTDVFLRELAVGKAATEMTKHRLTRYQAAGANSGFIPGLVCEEIAAELASDINMPLNLMVDNSLSSVDRLFKCGIVRFSVGPASFLHAYSALLKPQSLEETARSELALLDYNRMNSLFTI